MRNSRTEHSRRNAGNLKGLVAVLGIGATLIQSCTSDYGLHTMNCGTDAFDTLDECKETMVALGYVATTAEADAYAGSCCELTTDHRDDGSSSECYPLKEQADCMGDTDPNVKSDAGGADSNTIGVIAGNLTAVGAALDTAASLDSGKKAAQTEEVTAAMTDGTAGVSAAATAATKSSDESKSSAARQSGSPDASGGTGMNALDFRGNSSSGDSSSVGSGKGSSLGSSPGSGGVSGSLAERVAAALGLGQASSKSTDTSAIARLQGGGGPRGSGASSEGSPALSPNGVTALDFRPAEAPSPAPEEASPAEVAPMAGEDPDDYFDRIPIGDSLFERVQRKLHEKERLWMIEAGSR